MKNDCILIATSPSLNNRAKVERVFANPYISEVRYNVGARSPMSIPDTVSFFMALAEKYSKKFWIDIKGRQLRIAKWADPLYECVELNHGIEVSLPAKVIFRNSICSDITAVEGNKIFVDPIPREPVGAGQSINVIAKNLKIDGYLTDTDVQYLEVCRQKGLMNVFASFVEEFSDLAEILNIIPGAEIVCKIESKKGVEFISQYAGTKLSLMAARDDLYTEFERDYSIFKALKKIVECDPQAICASRIFTSLEHQEEVDLTDFSDLNLMYDMGYRRFMLCDNVCNYKFESALRAWRGFIND
ncbi:MAG: pyruvate kinase [Ignavibacteriales bacterium]